MWLGFPPPARSRSAFGLGLHGAAGAAKLLTMVVACISSVASWEEFIIGPEKGNALPLVDGIKVGYCSERQTKGCLVAKMWILVYIAHIQGLTTMKCPSKFSQAKPQLMNPS